MLELLSLLIRKISETIHAWDQFQEREIGYFLNDGDSEASSAGPKVSVATVDRTFLELGGILRRLKELEKELRKNNKHVSHLSQHRLEEREKEKDFN